MKKFDKSKNEQMVKDAANKLISMFQTGDMPEAITRTMLQRAKGDNRPSDRWSIGNQILMLANNTDDARTFLQWQEVARKVKKGATCCYILAPKIFTKEIEKENGEKEKKQILTGFKGIPVFRYEDTEGEEIFKPEYMPPKLPDFYEVAKKMGVEIEYHPGNGTAYGSFYFNQNKIRLHTHCEKTFYHELAHFVDHTYIAPLKNGQIPDQEIVAETVAAIMMNIQGVKGYEQHAYKYVSNYMHGMNEKNAVQAIMKLLTRIEKVTKIILDQAAEMEQAA
jgi:hypothetical protein